MRKQGSRQWRATFKQHDGTDDSHGERTYGTDADWDVVVDGYPCKFETVRGSENFRGLQLQAETTHLITGDFFGVENITTEMRCEIEGIVYGITAVYDPTNMRREMMIEMKRHIE